MSETNRLSEAAIQMHKNLKDRGELISDSKQNIINTYADAAGVKADTKTVNLPKSVETNDIWNRIYHTTLDASLRKDRLRI